MRPWLACLAFLVAGGCHHKAPPPPPPPAPAPAPGLQVVSVSPQVAPPGEELTLSVYGSGFASGATVQIGDRRAESVAFRGSNQLVVTVPPLELGTWDLQVQNPSGEIDQLRAALQIQPSRGQLPCGFVVLYFDTDRSDLRPEAQSTLTTLVDCYSGTDEPVRIAGHADARGTTDYNLSLSLERALAVQRFLLASGLPKERLPVTSYGEERPAAQGWGEAVWAQNRRVELTVDQP